MSREARTEQALRAENEELRTRLEEAEGTLRAIGGGEVDALVVGGQIYILESADAASNRFRSEVLAQVNDVIIAVDNDQRVTYLNPAAERQYGVRASEVLGCGLRDVLTYRWLRPEDEAAAAAALERVGVWRGENIHVKRDGEEIQVESTVNVLRDGGGATTGLLAIIRDITDRKRAEARLRESEARFAKAFSASPLVLTISSLKTGRLLEVNDTFVNVTGFSREEAIGRTTVELGLWARAREREDELETVRRTGQVRNAEYLFRVRDGREIVGLLSAEQIEMGGESFALTVIQDITARKQAEEALSALKDELEVQLEERKRLLLREQAARAEAESANRLKDEFLATVSHELRTPLTAILGWSRMLSGGQLDAASTRRALEIIERNAAAQSQLIEDILDVSRVITGKLRLEVRPVELTQVIEAAIDAVLPAADAKGIRLRRVLDSGASVVSGDPARLQQVVWNLLSNAIKFTPAGGRVDVRLARTGSQVEITVDDDGQGIAPDVLPHIFERFRQGDSSTSRAHGGLGLGLAIVRHLVEMHGGTVAAESPGEGHGATFTVRLPLAAVRSLDFARATEADGARHAAEADAAHSYPPELEGLRLLVVDDEEDTRALLKTVLEGCGASVVAVSSASEALAALRETRPHVLISDLGMPGEDGYSLIKRVRALPPEAGGQTPSAALTAYARVEDRMKVLRSGFQIHLPKPVEPAELIAVVANLAGRTAE